MLFIWSAAGWTIERGFDDPAPMENNQIVHNIQIIKSINSLCIPTKILPQLFSSEGLITCIYNIFVMHQKLIYA